MAFLGYPRGHRVNTETWAKGTCLQAIRMLTLEPERLKNRLATTRTRSPETDGTIPRDAQAACDFGFSASKSSPFFQSVSVMASDLACQRKACHGGLKALG